MAFFSWFWFGFRIPQNLSLGLSRIYIGFVRNLSNKKKFGYLPETKKMGGEKMREKKRKKKNERKKIEEKKKKKKEKEKRKETNTYTNRHGHTETALKQIKI